MEPSTAPRKRPWAQLLLLGSTVVAAFLYLASPVMASYVSVVTEGSEQVLRFEADSGERNDVGIGKTADGTELAIGESFWVFLRTGPGCTTRLTEVYCSASGVDRIEIFVGAEDDYVYLAPSLGAMPAYVDAGSDDDTLEGSSVPTVMDGGDGDDTFLAGGDGETDPDVFIGGDGYDRMLYRDRHSPQSISLDGVANDGSAGEHDDVDPDIEEVLGGHGADLIVGTDDADVLDGGAGADTLVGGTGDDTLRGNGVALECAGDVLFGDDGDDTLAVSGAAEVDGGPGDDTLNEWGWSCGPVEVFGGPGTDTVDLRGNWLEELSFSLDDLANDGASEQDNYHSDLENLLGGPRGMMLIGSDDPNTLTGNIGDDLLQGGGGTDVLIGSGGVDVADYSDHAAPVSVSLDGLANDGAPAELENVPSDIEQLRGGLGADTLIGDGGDNALDGGPGGDVLRGGGGTDAVDYSDREVGVTVDLDGALGDDGEPSEGDSVGSDVEGVFGGRGGDTLLGSAGPGFLVGNEGGDRLSDPGGVDQLDAGPGGDDVDSADGTQDWIACGDGLDAIVRDTNDVASDCEVSQVRQSPMSQSIQRPGLPPRPISHGRAGDQAAPTASLKLGRPPTRAALLARGLTVSIRCNEPCRARGRLVVRSASARALRRAGVSPRTTLARGELKTASTRLRNLKLRVTSAGRRALRGLPAATFDLVVTVIDRAGNHRQVVRHLRVR